ncbi:MAG: hypothetical protein IJ779_00565 [Ruminococcus sp.]|nr:hypothetical protein [Ruminococcus sp.]
MLEIQEKFSTEGYEALAERAGDVQLHITEALDGGRVTGYIAYAYGNDKTTVYGFDDGGDLLLCDGLVRSVMFKSVLKGIEHMLFETDKGFENLVKLRFLKEGSKMCSDLSGFMDSCKSCKNNK